MPPESLRVSLCRQLDREGQPSPAVREGLEKGLHCMQEAVDILKVKSLCKLSYILGYNYRRKEEFILAAPPL